MIGDQIRAHWGRAVRRFAAAGIVLGSAAAVEPSRVAGQQPALDLSGYRITFAEEFDGPLDVSPWGPGTRWIAHTPWAGDFGDARFVDPQPGFPFTIDDGVLVITAAKNPEGDWESGLLASVDRQNQGFMQTYGYFEARMRLPPGPGVWPAFWLIGRPLDANFSAEVDVVEFYGHAPERFSSSVHTWIRDGSRPNENETTRHHHGTDVTAEFHTYGVAIDEQTITFYFNRQPIWQTATPDTHHVPKMVLVNLALGSGFPIDETPDPSRLYVDYIRVYEECPAGGC